MTLVYLTRVMKYMQTQYSSHSIAVERYAIIHQLVKADADIDKSYKYVH